MASSPAILEYKIEISICPPRLGVLELGRSDCKYHQHLLAGKIQNITLDRTSVEIAGATYYMSLSARNKIGWGQRDFVQKSFLVIPRIITPADTMMTPLPVAVGQSSENFNYIHVWKGSTVRTDGRFTVMAKDVDVSEGMPNPILKVQYRVDRELQIENLTYFDESTRVQFDVLADASFFVCFNNEYPCIARIQIGSGLKLMQIYLEIFQYAAPELLNLLPGGGPAAGGTKIKILVRDYFGEKSRHAAGLPSMERSSMVSTLQQDVVQWIPVIRVLCGESDDQTGFAKATLKRLQDGSSKMSAIYELTASIPASPCGAGQVSVDFLTYANDAALCSSGKVPSVGVLCKNLTDLGDGLVIKVPVWHPLTASSMIFEYRSAGIVEVAPASGMINRGNERIEISIELEAIGDSFKDTLVFLDMSIHIPQNPPTQTRIEEVIQQEIDSESLTAFLTSYYYEEASSLLFVECHIIGRKQLNSTQAGTVASIDLKDRLTQVLKDEDPAIDDDDVTIDIKVVHHNLLVVFVTNSSLTYACKIIGEPVDVLLDSVQRTRIKCISPEITKSLAGILSLQVKGMNFYDESGPIVNLGPFTQAWEFLAPPDPYVVPESFLINNEQREPAWVKKRPTTSTLAQPVVSLRVANLVAKYESEFDNILVWFAESASNTQLLESSTTGMITSLSFALDVGGMEAGFYPLVIHVRKGSNILKDSKNQDVILNLTDIEIRDTSIPAIIAGSVVPTQGPPAGGTLVLMAISAASRLFEPETKDFLAFRMQDVYNTSVEAHGNIMAGPLLLSDWDSASSMAYFTFVEKTSNLKFGSSKLVQEYNRAIQVARGAMQGDEEDGSVALLVIQSPEWSGVGPAKANIDSGVGLTAVLEFDFEYWAPDFDVEPVIYASTQDGMASGMMSGI